MRASTGVGIESFVARANTTARRNGRGAIIHKIRNAARVMATASIFFFLKSIAIPVHTQSAPFSKSQPAKEFFGGVREFVWLMA